MDTQPAVVEQQEEIERGRGKNKRLWTSDEEAVLVDILYEMNETGWKVDTGHKNGYHTYIEKEMAIRILGCTIKANPHIKSKVKILKNLRAYILEIQKNGSGFGWDDEMKMVTCSKDLFIGWAKRRPGAKALYGKQFPHLEKLYEIYAKDKATGVKARGPGDEPVIDLTRDTNIDIDDEDEDEDEDDDPDLSVRGNNDQEIKNKSLPRKKKIEKEDVIKQSITHLAKSIGSLIEMEKQKMISVHEVVEQRKKLIPMLKAISRGDALFTITDVVKVASIIGLDDVKKDLFFNMDDEMKIVYAKQQIESNP